jgi:pimeloyl-ACP methyl ester carboxylesterase
MLRATRFLRAYLRPAPEREEEILLPFPDGGAVPATLYRPAGPRPAPAWIVLHGITVTGRHHPSLVRFARSMSAAGGIVLVPEIPSWRSLRIDLEAGRSTVAAAARQLELDPRVRAGGLGVVGFSFGGTQGLVTCADPELRERISSVVSFGGYCDLERALVCMATGEHEWRGVQERLSPDPYGRWIAAANYLVGVPGMEGMGRVAVGLHRMAVEAGRTGAMAADPVYDPLNRDLRAELGPEEQEVWDVLAPLSGRAPDDLEAARRIARGLARAALDDQPALDPHRSIPELRARVVLAHGQSDRLIPYTETLRLSEALAGRVPVSTTITRLFAHSRGAALSPLGYAAEGWRFLRLLDRALRT